MRILADDNNTLHHSNHHTSRQLSVFIETMNRVLRSGMKLAVIEQHGVDHTEHLVLVHPNVEELDSVFFLPACSALIILRGVKGSARLDKRARVVGGVLFPGDSDAGAWMEQYTRYI